MLRNALLFYWPKNKISCKPIVYRKLPFFSLYFGGERGIRTPGTVARTPHFECGPIDHSGISPMTVPEKSAFRDCKYRQKKSLSRIFRRKKMQNAGSGGRNPSSSTATRVMVRRGREVRKRDSGQKQCGRRNALPGGAAGCENAGRGRSRSVWQRTGNGARN